MVHLVLRITLQRAVRLRFYEVSILADDLKLEYDSEIREEDVRVLETRPSLHSYNVW